MAKLTSGGMQVIEVCGEMTWPAVTAEVADLGWKLRYNPGALKREDKLVLASIVDAYIQMVGDPQKKRNAVCRAIAEASKREV